MTDDLALRHTAPQQSVGPRPLPLFLELVRRAGERDPELARDALRGLAIYQQAPRHAAQHERSIVAQVGGASLRDCGGAGRPLLLVPSLINPPAILDLDPACSLADALGLSGRVLLLDWGPASQRLGLDVVGHITDLLLPLLGQLGEPAVLLGYCLGGTMALAAAAAAEERQVAAVVTLAAPWRFAAYPPAARAALRRLWRDAWPTAEQLGVLPIEVLQAAFWSLDPHRLVTKFARLGDIEPGSTEARRFIALEDWANGGEPLPLPAARELLEQLFEGDRPGRGEWLGGGLPRCPMLHVLATGDRITPPATAAPAGDRLACPAGHVGMVVGRSAPESLHRPLREWLEALPPPG